LVAIDHLAALIRDDDAVGVAVERDADIGAALAHRGAHALRRSGAAILIDIEAVRIGADGDDFRPELPEYRRRNLVGGAVRAVDHDAQALERLLLRKSVLHMFDIARLRIVD